MNEMLDDAVLVAYVDGELDARRRGEVQSRLRSDTEAGAKVRLMERSARMLTGAYDEVFDRPVPARLRALLDAARPAAAPAVAQGSWWSRIMAFTRPGGMGPVTVAAATLGALVIGVALGRIDLAGSDATYVPAAVENSAPLGLVEAQMQALEGGADGIAMEYQRPDLGVTGWFTPLAGVAGPDKLACRGFRDQVVHAAATIASVGVACRGADGRWVMLTVPVEPID